MSLSSAQISAIADELAAAEQDRTMIPLLTRRFPEMTVEDSYAVQNEWRRRGVDAGRRLVGRKIGLTSKVMQAATGISEPDYGAIFADQVHENGSVIEHAQYTGVRIEVELAFVLGKPLAGPHTTIFDVMQATDYVIPSLEILSSRIEMEGRTIVDTISDNAALGGIVLGGNPTRPHDVDLRWVSALLYRNETIEESGVAAAVLNHPAMGVAWLADKLSQHDDRLEAGEIVLAGSFTRPMWVHPGDTVLADYGSMGTIACRFE
ncbi:fumarylacetoacetate hydrolase family protein [Microbacterium sp. G2-8]|uniref:fumarylacetoacetate hydrolase family protein n=1 Tax=Microbacterium sp. G2-8 TaxID=2842454 RepID=UPI001C89D342|nr:fumarylacetoacetate hydrolase family protein [Microbacterium sp. G2-8]